MHAQMIYAHNACDAAGSTQTSMQTQQLLSYMFKLQLICLKSSMWQQTAQSVTVWSACPKFSGHKLADAAKASSMQFSQLHTSEPVSHIATFQAITQTLVATISALHRSLAKHVAA
jgi:hypothetical protein